MNNSTEECYKQMENDDFDSEINEQEKMPELLVFDAAFSYCLLCKHITSGNVLPLFW